MRTRWLGATGVRVPEIAVEGEDLDVAGTGRVRVGQREVDALVLANVSGGEELHRAHLAGKPVVVRAANAAAVAAALAYPEVSCALVPPEQRELRELDLRRLKYG